MIRQFGWALLVLGASGTVGPSPAGAQATPEPRPHPRFVGVPGHVINIDQVAFVEQLGQPGDNGRTEVHLVGRAQPLLLFGDAGKQFVAALRDANGGPIPAPAGKAEAPAPAPGAGAALYDGFDGRLALDWKQVRLDPAHLSLARKPGFLTITTQRGSIHGTPDGNEAGAEFLARNLTLVANPLAPAADFAITTHVVGFTPAERYQQASLIVYADDDNYFKFGYEYDWNRGGGQTFFGVAEAAGVPEHLPVAAEAGLKDYWLRVTRRGDRYEYATSLDGRAWRVHGTATWAGPPARVGLLAKNGGAEGAAEVDAHFDFFELQAVPPAPLPAQAPADRPAAAVEPRILLAPPIPLDAMTDHQLAAWAGYLRVATQQYGNLAKAFRATGGAYAAIYGDRPPNDAVSARMFDHLDPYIRQQVGPDFDLTRPTAPTIARVADELDALAARCRPPLAAAEAEAGRRPRRDAAKEPSP